MDRLLFLIITAMLCTQGHAHDNSSQATYLGNEGVMVARGDTRILFDAFYSDSYSRYTLVPKEIAEAMLAGEAPYDGIDAIFVSHVHGDHFTAGPAVTYLRAHPQVQLYGTEQIREAIEVVQADGINRLLGGEGTQAPLGAARHGARRLVVQEFARLVLQKFLVFGKIEIHGSSLHPATTPAGCAGHYFQTEP